MKFHKHERGDLQYKKKTCPTCKTSMKAGNLSRHMRKHDKQLHLDLIEELERGKEKKKKDYERGVFIKNSIRNGEIDPDILTEEHHKAMKTKFPALKVEVILRLWQEKLVELIKPSEREIIWIVGSVGNEGKTWFQKWSTGIRCKYKKEFKMYFTYIIERNCIVNRYIFVQCSKEF